MQSRVLIRSIIVLIFVAVIGTPLFYLGQGVYPYTLPKMAFFEAVVEAIGFLWLALIIIDRRYRWRSTPLTAALAAFLGILALTAALGVDPWRSFWSTQERALGVVTFLHAGILILVLAALSREVPWRRLWYASLGTALVVDILAFLQLHVPDLLLQEAVGARPGATFGNPTFLAGYLIFNVFVGIYLLISELKEPETDGGARQVRFRTAAVAFLVVSLATNAATVMLAETRGDILGLGVGLVALIAFFAVRPPAVRVPLLRRRTLYASALMVLALFAAVFWTTKSSGVWAGIPGLARFQNLTLSSADLGPRLIALKAAWRGFLDRPVLGWGWDNFNVVFNKYYDPKALEANYQETRFDKPHNFVLEDLVVGGLPLALARVALLGALIVVAFRLRRDRHWGPVVTATTAAYIVRNLFVFDTIGPLLMFALIVGHTDGVYREERTPQSAAAPHARPAHAVPPGRGQGIVVWGAIVAAAIVIYSLNITTLEASYRQFWGFKYFIKSQPSLGVKSFKSAIGLWTPYRWNLERDYATALAEAYFYNHGIVSKDDVREAVHMMETVAAEHPADAYNHYVLVDLYNQVSDIDPGYYLAAAEREAAIALQLSPNRQEVYFSLAKTKSLRGDYTSALSLLDKALTLDPNVPDAHFYYGLIAYADNQPERGYTEIKAALALGRAWKNANEPRVVANFFADSGHLDEAIDLYKKALEFQPSDLEAKAKLGIAYFFRGDPNLARKYLSEVLQRADLTKSPSYPDVKAIAGELGIPL